MKEVWREGASILLQLVGTGLEGRTEGNHAADMGKAVALRQIAGRAGCDDVFPRRPTAAGPWNHMVEGQVVGGEGAAAILAGEAVAQEDVEAGEGRAARCRNELFQRNDTGQPDFETWGSDDPVIVRYDVDPFQKDRLDRFLPGP